MKVAVWNDTRYGPAIAATLPAQGLPEVAQIRQQLPPSALVALWSKGTGLSWEQWADNLTRRMPSRQGYWSMEDVPATITARAALALARSRAADRNLSPPAT